MVLAVERVERPATKARHPALGEDVKVIGVRTAGDTAHRRVRLRRAVRRRSRRLPAQEGRDCPPRDRRRARGRRREVEVAVNAADGDAESTIYLTVTGLSAEAGDDGQVGRGNRANGLITPYRPMRLEAVAGKNPVTHVGKLYNLAASRIAHAVLAEIPAVTEAYCWLLGRIGDPIDEPQVADVRLRLEEPGALEAVRPQALAVVHDHLRGISTLWREIVGGAIRLW